MPPRSGGLTMFAVSGGLVLLAWLVFGQAVRHDFVNYDDPTYVLDNSFVTQGVTTNGVHAAFTRTVSSNWHPLTMLSHMMDVQLFGLDAGGHHFTNVFLHATNVVLLFTFLWRTTAALWPSAFVAALFAIHPLRVESVAWVSERKDVLSAFFFMLTLQAHAAYARKPSAARASLTAGALACGLLSKSMLVTAPVVLLLCDRWPLRRTASIRDLVSEKLPLFALAGAVAVVALLTQAGATSSLEAVPLHARLTNAAWSTLTYIGQMFYPAKLAPFYPYPSEPCSANAVVFAVAVIMVLTASALLARRTRPYVAIGWFWYVVMLLPVLGLVQVGGQSHADRYTYLPQIGLYVMIAWGIAEATAGWRYRRPILATAAAAVVVAFAVHASRQTKVWRNSETLWRHTLAVTEENHVAHASLARYLWSEQRVTEAVPHFEAALALAPGNAEFHTSAGVGLVQLGRTSEAVAHWEKALEINPDDSHAQGNLAWVFATCPEASMRDGARAVQLARQAIAGRSEKTPFLVRTLAAALAEAGQFAEAIETAREALQLARSTGPPELVEELDAQIRDYAEGRPLRDASLASVRPAQRD